MENRTGYRPFVYTGAFSNRSGTDSKLDLLFCRFSVGSVLDRFHTKGRCLHGTVWNRSRSFQKVHVNKSRSGPRCRFWTLPVGSCVNVAESLKLQLTFIASSNGKCLGRKFRFQNQNEIMLSGPCYFLSGRNESWRTRVFLSYHRLSLSQQLSWKFARVQIDF